MGVFFSEAAARQPKIAEYFITKKFSFPGQMARPVLLIVLAAGLMSAAPAAAQTRLQSENLKEFEDLLGVQNTQKSLGVRSLVAPRSPVSTLDRLMTWSRIALESTALDHTPVEAGSGDDPRRFAEQLGPHRSSYAMAVAHIAMFEAVNAAHQRYKSYTGLAPIDKKYASSKIVVDRAIAQAGHDALVAVYPYQKDRLDGLLSIDIARMPKLPADEVQIGSDLGMQAAKSIVQMRQNDGSSEPEPTYGKDFKPITCADPAKQCPGIWSPDPVSKLTVALGANWSHVRPFVLKTADQFRAPPPPALGSPEYAYAYNEVKRFGGDGATTPTERRDFQTFEGIFWAYDGTPALCAPPRLYNQVVDTIALAQQYGDVEDFARLLALTNTAMADAGISAWEAKYHYQLWRPVTGVRNGDIDNNAGTAADSNWTPLGGQATNARGPNFTPPFPSYPSGHAVFGGAVFGVLRHFWPDATPFVLVSDEFNGLNYAVGGEAPRPNIPEAFVSFNHAEYSNGRSRIWLGIHWQFDADAGIRQGNQIADYVFANAFQPVAK